MTHRRKAIGFQRTNEVTAIAEKAMADFAEWASLFSGKIMVMIVVYADESGTHDSLGNQEGSKYPVVAGFAARKSTWDTFCVSWSAVLKTYDDVPYFHGRELRAAREAIVHNKAPSKELQKNPYYIRKWSLEKIESFWKSLAKIAGAGNKIPIISAVNIPIFNKIKEGIPNKDPYKLCIAEFFQVYLRETELQWGKFKSDVTFVFDQSSKMEWLYTVHEVFQVFQNVDARMSGPNFADKKKPQFFPLQASDLLAYRARQLADDWANDKLDTEPVDNMLFKNLLKSAPIKYPYLRQLLK